ncbi:N-lysine methyltransferase SMYD2-B-like [Paramacrobiotus metropolitanus]|uniref:N-lysine methyltransferase SMYD2-B-like n=1 Tax=Paramacrobiotus metropolitanus TaxID=2943436 RepID=UPI002445F129|nr:N-lysine methyltransferase SMYD2-B-like [Paramacrobiotus metropolitanus]XP_055344291.1 N-lysine methyltransferase SMYD2-B-like [Paramacrobiotus metropolitanus]XP_055344292.1 N-lysine methyltransferase SMYD2-B-like [Paramacrobiotus metropolitanus]
METQESVPITEKRSFAPGDVVMACDPLVWVLERSAYKTHCAFCLKDGQGLRKCAGCQLHHYCNTTCQTADWKMEHKAECAMLKQMGLVNGETEPTVILLAGLRGGRTSQPFPMSTDIFRDMTTKLDFKVKRNAMMDVSGMGSKSVAEVLRMMPANHADPESHPVLPFEKSSMLPDKSIYYEILSYNTWPLYDVLTGYGKDPIGFALYSQTVRHQMTPVCWDINVVLNRRGRQLFIHAAEDIPQYTGLKDLRYSELMEPSRQTCEERRGEFRKRHGYPCPCRRCTDEYDADINRLRCVTVGCTNRIPSDRRAQAACSECGAINRSRLVQFRRFVQEYEGLKWRHNGTASMAMNMMMNLGHEVENADILQPDAHFRHVCAWMIPNKYFNENRLEEGWKMTVGLTLCVRKIYPKYDVCRGLQLMGQGITASTALYQRAVNRTGRLPGPGKNELGILAPQISHLAIKYCEEAKEIFTVLFGEESQEVQQAEAALERVTTNIRPIERAFRGSGWKAKK